MLNVESATVVYCEVPLLSFQTPVCSERPVFFQQLLQDFQIRRRECQLGNPAFDLQGDAKFLQPVKKVRTMFANNYSEQLSEEVIRFLTCFVRFLSSVRNVLGAPVPQQPTHHDTMCLQTADVFTFCMCHRPRTIMTFLQNVSCHRHFACL